MINCGRAPTTERIFIVGDRIEIDVSGVSVGECCGLGLLQRPARRADGSYQRYLNGTPDGELRYVVMIRDEVETDSDTTQFRHPITGNYLPESVDGYVFGKID